MKGYRVSELAKPRGYVSLAMEVASSEGTKIHTDLAEIYQSRGRHIEEFQLCWLTTSSPSIYSPILGYVSGHPDMWEVRGSTLHVIDWKTIPPHKKPVPEKWWWDQLMWYAYQILINHPNLGVGKIKLSLWIYNRKVGFDAKTASYTPYEISISPSKLKAIMQALVLSKIGKGMKLVPSDWGVIKHA